MFLVTYLQNMVILISKHRTESQLLEEKWKKKEKEMKTMKRINVDLNLNSDPLGRKKKDVSALDLMRSCFSGDIFCLGYSFVWGLAEVWNWRGL